VDDDELVEVDEVRAELVVVVVRVLLVLVVVGVGLGLEVVFGGGGFDGSGGGGTPSTQLPKISPALSDAKKRKRPGEKSRAPKGQPAQRSTTTA
jgi:hypothetical protein